MHWPAYIAKVQRPMSQRDVIVATTTDDAVTERDTARRCIGFS